MTPEAPVRAGARTFAGLFLVTLSTLTYQLLLTRTFSVTMYYHFAFVAISVTMFGMAVGAIAVYLGPRLFVADRVSRHLALGAALFAATIVLSYLTHLSIPFLIEPSLVSAYALALTYAALSVPFVMSGGRRIAGADTISAAGWCALRRGPDWRGPRLRDCRSTASGRRRTDRRGRNGGNCIGRVDAVCG
jgi:hypothetical protein